MKKWFLVFVFIIIHLSTTVYAQQEVENLTTREGMYLELGGRGDPDAIGGEIGVSGYVSEHLSLKGGLAFLASESFDDTFVGGTLGVRYNIAKRLSPFVGFGVFAGYSEETVSAEDDGIDNDEDGDIDEDGEEKEVIKDVFGSVYPEVGFHFWATDTVRLTLTSKYHLTTEGRENYFWVFSFGIVFMF